MKPIKVSVIIPVFNAETYLGQCIGSIVSQTLGDIEIIIINDGSTDNSKAIISQYAANNSRIIFIDGPKEGVSSARNKGIKIAKGEYIGFVDADDYIVQTMYEILYKKTREASADIAICNVMAVGQSMEITSRLSLENKLIDISNNREPALVQLMRFKYDFANWNKIYSSAIIKEKRLLFNENMLVYEDLLFNLCYFQYAEKGISIEDNLYQYRIHPASVSNAAAHDQIAEYNMLFNAFNDFCTQKGFEKPKLYFNKEMCRGFYNTIIPQVFTTIKKKPFSLFQKAKLFAQELKKINEAIFVFDKDELKGVQGFKKLQLMKKRYWLFSFIISIKG